MRNRDSNLKNGLIIFVLLIAIFIVATSSPNLNRNLSRNFSNNLASIKSYLTSKISNNSNGNLVETYSEYHSVVKKALDNYESNVTIAVKNYDKSIINEEVFNKALEDNPLGGTGFTCNMTIGALGSSTTTVKFEFAYPEPREVLLKKAEEVKGKVKEVVAELVKPKMKDYEKEKVLHDYLVSNCRYDERYFTDNMPGESYTAYGALIKGVAVCQGYAVAMNLLLEEAGIDSMLITGEGFYEETGENMSHAWNLVKIGGEYYHLDPTWNDPIIEDGTEIVGYSYFNVTDEQIGVNHIWDKTKFPPATATEFVFNNLNFVEKDSLGNDIKVVKSFEEFSNGLVADMIASKSSVTYKILNFEADVDTIEKYIRQADGQVPNGRQITYGYWEDEILRCGYVTVEFKNE